jgi:hypothetical protein
MRDLAAEETSVESMSELLDELERVRDRQEKIITLEEEQSQARCALHARRRH